MTRLDEEHEQSLAERHELLDIEVVPSGGPEPSDKYGWLCWCGAIAGHGELIDTMGQARRAHERHQERAL